MGIGGEAVHYEDQFGKALPDRACGRLHNATQSTAQVVHCCHDHSRSERTYHAQVHEQSWAVLRPKLLDSPLAGMPCVRGDRRAAVEAPSGEAAKPDASTGVTGLVPISTTDAIYAGSEPAEVGSAGSVPAGSGSGRSVLIGIAKAHSRTLAGLEDCELEELVYVPHGAP